MLYKAGATETPDSLREKRRHLQIELRKEKRDLVLSGKRIRFDVDDLQDYDITEAEVIDATRKLVSKTGDRQNLLKFLRQAFAQGTGLIDQFFSVENSLDCLTGIFMGNDPEQQLEAAWCLTNLAAGTDDHTNAVIKCAAPYLITYLSSGNSSLQDQCAWAIGNLAGGSDSCRKTLMMQGTLSPLVSLLQCPVLSVVQSAAFALSNLAKDEEAQKQIVSAGVIPVIAALLEFSANRLDLISEISWVLTYLSVSGHYTEDLLSHGILSKIKSVIIEITRMDNTCIKVLTPLLRCLGNIVCKISNGEEIYKDKTLLQAIKVLFQSNHLHLQKESLWVVSNIAVFDSACDVLVALEMVPPIISMLSSIFDIRKEALYALCNIAAHGQRYCCEMLRNNALSSVVPLLKLKDIEICQSALSLIEMMLNSNREQVLKEFEECGGMECLEVLEYSNNDELRTRTNELLEKYFYNEDYAANE